MSGVEALDAIATSLTAAHEENGRVAVSGGQTYRMSIPGRAGYDTDLIIGGALSHGETLVAALRAVLDLHAPEYGVNGHLCRGCDVILTDAHPDCPTVAAITTALGGRP